MYKVIMAPTDGSPLERSAIARAIRLAAFYKAQLRLVRVVHPTLLIDSLNGMSDPGFQRDAFDEEVASAKRQLDALANRCRREGVREVVTAVLNGPTGPMLVEYARESAVDIIVMASHARGDAARILLGSVTDFIVRHTEIPVLVVKKVPLLAPDENAMHCIIVPLDGSERGEEVLPQVAALSISPFTTVHLLQVLQPVTFSQREIREPALPWWENEFTAADDYLEHAAAVLRDQGVGVVSDVIIGDDIAESILRHAKECRADLIAIATSGTGGLKRLLFGSVADQVVRDSSISVLVLHPKTNRAGGQDRAAERATFSIPQKAAK